MPDIEAILRAMDRIEAQFEPPLFYNYLYKRGVNMLDAIIKQLKEMFPHGHPKFTEVTLKELETHSKKNKDYAQGGDPLGNFKRVANILSNYPNLPLDNPVVIALIYSLKQLDAALWMLAKRYEGEVEGIDSRLMDVHIYGKLARLLAQDLSQKQE